MKYTLVQVMAMLAYWFAFGIAAPIHGAVPSVSQCTYWMILRTNYWHRSLITTTITPSARFRGLLLSAGSLVVRFQSPYGEVDTMHRVKQALSSAEAATTLRREKWWSLVGVMFPSILIVVGTMLSMEKTRGRAVALSSLIRAVVDTMSSRYWKLRLNKSDCDGA